MNKTTPALKNKLRFPLLVFFLYGCLLHKSHNIKYQLNIAF